MQAGNKPKHRIPFGWHVPSQRMLSAKEVTNGRACECVCAACGSRLQARQGSIRVWYFAHDEETKCLHASEAAIHRMAKQLIVERCTVFMPSRQLSRTIHGKKLVWTEKINVDVQAGGLQPLIDCIQEKTIGNSKSEGESRRPDVFASLDGLPLAIEILNTHAVDFEKQKWLERRGHSVLEITVADIALLPPEQILEALETCLFQTSDHSVWLAHAKDQEAKQALDLLEAQTRDAHKEEELALLAKLDAEEAEIKRKEEARKRFQDIEDFRIRLGNCTLRVGRNEQRVSLKAYGFAPDAVFEGIKLLARKHQGRFNSKGRCWEFYRHSDTEPFFKHLGAELQQVCLERFCAAHSPVSRPIYDAMLPKPEVEKPPPVYFDDPALQEAFDERAAILEFEAKINRLEAEKIAFHEIATQPTNSCDSKSVTAT